MTRECNEGDGGRGARILETVRGTLGRTSRRELLAAIGIGGLGGLAGCSGRGNENADSEISPPESGQAGGFAVEDDGTAVGENVDTLNVDTGLDVSVEGTTATIASRTAESTDGTYVGRPGDLQSALADAAEDGIGRVRLVAGTTYERNEPLEVPSDVVLDCSGARVDVTADVNCFELRARSQVRFPRVRTTSVDGYSGSVFHVYPRQFDDGFVAPMPLWTVYGGYSEMTPDEGTCIELHGSGPTTNVAGDPHREWNVYFCHVAHNCLGGRRYAYLHRDGGDPGLGGHVNGNVIQGLAAGATRFVETDDDAGEQDNMVNGNRFHLAVQAHRNAEWLWYANKGKHNTLGLWGQHWDYHSYADSNGDGHPDWWYIGPNAAMNFLRRNRVSAPTPAGLAATVVDDSDGASGSRYLLDERAGVPVDDLGG